MAETIDFPTEPGVPVMGHIGLTPQSVSCRFVYACRGATRPQPDRSWTTPGRRGGGCVLWVLEAYAAPLAREITQPMIFRPSASAPATLATARCWCWKTCWG